MIVLILNTTVVQDTSSDPTEFATSVLDDQLEDAFNLNNVDKVIQLVNVFAASISIANCSLAPDCTSLNRSSCFTTSHTCEGCLDGYKGLIYILIINYRLMNHFFKLLAF